ncbi:hypothetical protein LTR53_012490, partial [Teratosphaeriaceae sp. CCFEE 6253]
MAPPDSKKNGKRQPDADITNSTPRSPLSPTASQFSPRLGSGNGAGSPGVWQTASAAERMPTTSGLPHLLSPRRREGDDGLREPHAPRTARARSRGRNRDVPATPARQNTDESRSSDEARLARQKAGLEDEADDWYNKWGEEQIKNRALEEQLAESEKERKRLFQQTQDQTKEVEATTKTADDLSAELDRMKTENHDHETKYNALKTQLESLDNLLKITESTVQDTEKKLRDVEEEQDDYLTINAGLYEELDGSEAARLERLADLEKNGDAQQQLDKVMQTFQEEFSNLSKGVNIDDYLKQFRESVHGSRDLRRDGSQVSLGSAFGEPHSARRPGVGDNRHVSSASIGDELGDHDLNSGDEFDVDNAQDAGSFFGDADNTLKFNGISPNGLLVGNDPPRVNNWASGEALEVPSVYDFGVLRNMNTQTPPKDEKLIPDPWNPKQKATYVDAAAWTDNDKGFQTDFKVPVATQAEVDELQKSVGDSGRLRQAAEVSKQGWEKKFMVEWRAVAAFKKQVAEDGVKTAALEKEVAELKEGTKTAELEKQVAELKKGSKTVELEKQVADLKEAVSKGKVALVGEEQKFAELKTEEAKVRETLGRADNEVRRQEAAITHGEGAIKRVHQEGLDRARTLENQLHALSGQQAEVLELNAALKEHKTVLEGRLST